VDGQVIMYADRVTDSMRRAIDVTEKRRQRQEAFNLEHGIVPQTVVKGIRSLIEAVMAEEEMTGYTAAESGDNDIPAENEDGEIRLRGAAEAEEAARKKSRKGSTADRWRKQVRTLARPVAVTDPGSGTAFRGKKANDGAGGPVGPAGPGLTPDKLTRWIARLTREMHQAAKDLDFEKAAAIRDRIRELNKD
jgi:excinuclease UvrABC helicase subunit UvrB